MKTIIIPKSDAPVMRAYGDELQFHLGAAQNGVCTMFTDTTPPGGGPPPHFHVDEDEWWFVLEGQVEFFNGESWTRVAPDGAVFMPKHSLHTFRNAGDQSSRQITLTAPAGFETFFKESAALFEGGAAPDLQRIREVGAAGGIYFPTLAPDDATKRGRPLLQPVMTQPEQARVLRAFGEEVRVLLDGQQTGGLFTAFVEVTPPDGGPPPHFHEREDEWFYVLDGCVSFLAEGKWTDAHPGDVVFATRSSVHTFKNNTDSPTRMLIHTSPSGLENFFAEAAKEFAKPGGPDMNRAVAIAVNHGIHFVQP